LGGGLLGLVVGYFCFSALDLESNFWVEADEGVLGEFLWSFDGFKKVSCWVLFYELRKYFERVTVQVCFYDF
jgi:hypothetical protein